jgi:hypothetical protein
MAIKSNLWEINQLHQKVQKQENMQQLVSETLLWLSQNLDNKLVVDPIMAGQIDKIIDWLDIKDQIDALEKELLSQKQKLRSSTNNTPVVVPIYSTDTLTKTKKYIKSNPEWKGFSTKNACSRGISSYMITSSQRRK